MDINLFFEKTNFPTLAKEKIIQYLSNNDLYKFSKTIDKLTTKNAELAYNELVEQVGIENNFLILVIEILASLKVYDKYLKLGISDEIYFSTMQIFSRYVSESIEKNGVIGFDRAFWAWRHTSMQIFRLGTFEYEYTEYEGDSVISLHIPPDAILKDEEMTFSFNFAREFTSKYFPERKNDKIITETWLISPKLKELLGENSKILSFMDRFKVTKTVPHEGALKFLFGIKNTFDLSKVDINELPENTSLQRAVKNLYLKGERIGSGYGILIE